MEGRSLQRPTFSLVMSKRLFSILATTITLVTCVPNLLTANFILPEYDTGQSEYFIWDSWSDEYTNYTLADIGQDVSPFPQGEGNLSTDTDSSTGPSILFRIQAFSSGSPICINS